MDFPSKCFKQWLSSALLWNFTLWLKSFNVRLATLLLDCHIIAHIKLPCVPLIQGTVYHRYHRVYSICECTCTINSQICNSMQCGNISINNHITLSSHIDNVNNHIQKFVDTHAFHKCMVMGSQLVHCPQMAFQVLAPFRPTS